MKRLISSFALLFSVSMAFADTPTKNLEGNFKIHLFFGDTAPFVDDLSVQVSPEGKVTGRMHVPNDFDADIENITFNGSDLKFDILVPKNPSRPVDLVFRYESKIYSTEANQYAGFVTTTMADGKPVKPSYTASFLMFRKPK